jgi:hypothetical protein
MPDHGNTICKYNVLCLLQDFVPQSSSPNIDYAAIHLWPDNWNTTSARLIAGFPHTSVCGSCRLRWNGAFRVPANHAAKQTVSIAQMCHQHSGAGPDQNNKNNSDFCHTSTVTARLNP